MSQLFNIDFLLPLIKTAKVSWPLSALEVTRIKQAQDRVTGQNIVETVVSRMLNILDENKGWVSNHDMQALSALYGDQLQVLEMPNPVQYGRPADNAFLVLVGERPLAFIPSGSPDSLPHMIELKKAKVHDPDNIDSWVEDDSNKRESVFLVDLDLAAQMVCEVMADRIKRRQERYKSNLGLVHRRLAMQSLLSPFGFAVFHTNNLYTLDNPRSIEDFTQVFARSAGIRILPSGERVRLTSFMGWCAPLPGVPDHELANFMAEDGTLCECPVAEVIFSLDGQFDEADMARISEHALKPSFWKVVAFSGPDGVFIADVHVQGSAADERHYFCPCRLLDGETPKRAMSLRELWHSVRGTVTPGLFSPKHAAFLGTDMSIFQTQKFSPLHSAPFSMYDYV